MEEGRLYFHPPGFPDPRRLKGSLKAAGVSKTGKKTYIGVILRRGTLLATGGAHTAVPHETPSMPGCSRVEGGIQDRHRGIDSKRGQSDLCGNNRDIQIYCGDRSYSLQPLPAGVSQLFARSRANNRWVAREYPCKDRQRLPLNEDILIRMAPCWQMTSRERP